MTELTTEQKEKLRADREAAKKDTATDNPNTRRFDSQQSTQLSVPQQVHNSAQLTAKSSAGAGKTQAVTDAKSFALSYAQTTEQLTAVVAKHVEAARNQMSAAISSVDAEDVVKEAGDPDFLTAFDSELTALLAQ